MLLLSAATTKFIVDVPQLLLVILLDLGNLLVIVFLYFSEFLLVVLIGLVALREEFLFVFYALPFHWP